jgi:hypothetical protein
MRPSTRARMAITFRLFWAGPYHPLQVHRVKRIIVEIVMHLSVGGKTQVERCSIPAAAHEVQVATGNIQSWAE